MSSKTLTSYPCSSVEGCKVSMARPFLEEPEDEKVSSLYCYLGWAVGGLTRQHSQAAWLDLGIPSQKTDSTSRLARDLRAPLLSSKSPCRTMVSSGHSMHSVESNPQTSYAENDPKSKNALHHSSPSIVFLQDLRLTRRPLVTARALANLCS